ncbi:MAG: WD40 repeat domain-containing serine/threonine protein kinase [Planctomycetota bacterium]
MSAPRDALPLDSVRACFEEMLAGDLARARARHGDEVFREAEALLEAHRALERDGAPEPRGFAAAEGALAPGTAFDGFVIESPLGSGATGEVYGALERSAARRVAIKLLPPESARVGAERMHRETMALAALEHPGIARLYRSGSVATGGARRRYLAMELVRGARTLSQWRDERPRSRDECARLMAEVAEAVAFAHGRGVIHCDLKPSNVLVDEADRAVVIDFGISRLLDEDGAAARTVSILGDRVAGTLAYIAPESLEPSARADVRVDVFALGAMLYELLAQRPFRRLDGLALPQRLAAISREEPVRLDAHDRALRGDLARIVARAKARDPERRYPSAASLAADLRAHLAGLPVMPELQPLGERVRRAVARHKAATAVAALLASVLLATTAISVSFARAAHADARRANLSAAARALDDCDLLLVARHVEALGPDDGTLERALLERALAMPGAVVARDDWYESAWGPDGSWFVANGHTRPTAQAEKSLPCLARFDRTPAGWRERWRVDAIESGIGTLCVTDDGTRVVDVSFRGDLRILDADSGKPLDSAPRAQPARDVYGLAVRSDGLIAHADGELVLRRIDAVSVPVARIDCGVGTVRALGFSPAEPRLLAVAGHEGVVLVDVDAARVIHRFGETGGYSVCLAWSADGHTLFVGNFDWSLRAFETAHVEPRWTARGHTDVVWSVAVLETGAVATAGADGSLRMWRATDGVPLASAPLSDDVVWSMRASPGGDAIAVASRGALRVQSMQRLRAWTGTRAHVPGTAWASDASVRAEPREDGTVAVQRDSEVRFATPAGEGPVDVVAISPDGALLAALRRDGTISLLDARSGAVRWGTRELALEDRHEPNGVPAMAVSPRAGLLLVASRGHHCVALSLADGTAAWRCKFGAGCVAVAASDDGRTAFAADRDGRLARIDTRTGAVRATARWNRTRVNALAVDGTATRVLAASTDGSLRVLEADSLEEVLSLSLDASAQRSLRFDHEGIRCVDKLGVERVR